MCSKRLHFWWVLHISIGPGVLGHFDDVQQKKLVSTARFGATFFRRTDHFGKVRMGSGSSNYIRAIALLSSKQHPGYLYGKTGTMRKSAQ
jgi:hypothetical protein